MGWISEKLLGKGQVREAEFVSNLYDAMVLRGGPSSEADNHIDTEDLEIPLPMLERFASKRQIMLEAFLFVATSTAKTPAEDGQVAIEMLPHPLAVELAKLLKTKWRERGIEVSDHGAVGERCFDEVSGFLEHPFRWGKTWLDEFYDDPEKSGEHYILWTEQCLKELTTMKRLVEQNL